MPYDSLIDRTGAESLIPEQRSREIIQNLPQQSAVLQLFRRVTMSSKVTRMPVLSAFPAAYWVNGDTGLKQTAEMAWGNKTLAAEELAVLVPVPEAVLDDADFDIWAEVRPRLEEAFGLALDQAALFGEGKPASWTDPAIVPGAVAAGNAVALGTSATDFAEDINNVMAAVEADGYDVNGFIARRAIRARLRGLRDGNNNFLFSPGLAQGTPSTLYGETLAYVSNGAWDDTAAELIAGDFTRGIIGIRQDITLKLLDQAVISNDVGAVVLNLAQQDAVALRAVMRVAYAVANPLNRLNQDAATRWPFGVLTPDVTP